MSDHDTSDAALVARLREFARRCIFDHSCEEHSALTQAADALARRIAEGERLRKARVARLEPIRAGMGDVLCQTCKMRYGLNAWKQRTHALVAEEPHP